MSEEKKEVVKKEEPKVPVVTEKDLVRDFVIKVTKNEAKAADEALKKAIEFKLNQRADAIKNSVTM